MTQLEGFTPIFELKPHPMAELLPSMGAAEYAGLLEDIRENGLIEPIWIDSASRIIDGRHRYRACVELGREPITRHLETREDPLTFILSMNLHRRHLSVSQRSMLALRVKETLLDQSDTRYTKGEDEGVTQAWENPGVNLPLGSEGGGRKDEIAAAALGVSRKSVQYAQEVETSAIDEIQSLVREGELSVSAAKARGSRSRSWQASRAGRAVAPITPSSATVTNSRLA